MPCGIRRVAETISWCFSYLRSLALGISFLVTSLAFGCFGLEISFSFDLFLSHLIPSHLTASHSMSSLVIWSHLVSSNLSSSERIPPHLSASQLISAFLSFSFSQHFSAQLLSGPKPAWKPNLGAKGKKKDFEFFKTILKGKGTCQKRGEKNQEKLNVATLAQPRHSDLQAPSCKRQ